MKRFDSRPTNQLRNIKITPHVLDYAEGSVMVEFVVDTTGRVEPGSIQLTQADHALFASAVRDVLPRYRFIPAMAAGHRVRQLVRLPFRFDLHNH